MGKLASLLKWKKAVIIRDEKGLVAKDEEGSPVIVYLRVIGDKDLEEATTRARYASAIKRASLAVTTSEEYISNVAIFDTATPEQCKEMILQGKGTNWTAEAFAEVTVPDVPKIEEVAADPDAPSLEELEKLDKLIAKTEEDYRKEITEYVRARESKLRSDLETMSEEELIELAKQQFIVVLSVQTYIDTLIDEKVWRAVYQDDKYAVREFKNVEEFQNLNVVIKEQLREEYRNLEAGFDDVKN